MRLMKHTLIIATTLFAINTYSQQNSTMTNQKIVKKFLNGFNNPAQIQESLNLLADDYKFKNPMVELNSKVEFIKLAQEIGKAITGIEIINTVGNGNWVATFYEFKSSISGLESNTASEWFRLENGMIKESHLIYDASEWRKFYEKMKK
ncbi:MAG: nuclear transport factor 2 family protein [Cellulophaga sp.]